MKNFIILISVLFCTTVFAHTINWHDGNTTTQTTCNAGDNITPPTPIGKYGYHFVEWKTYLPIEYLQSSGTQWIDTEFRPNEKLKIVAKINLTQRPNSGWSVLFAVNFSSQSPFLILRDGMTFGDYFCQTNFNSNNLLLNYDYTIIVENGFLKINDKEFIAQPVSSYSTNGHLKLLFDGISEKGCFKIYYFQIYDNNILVRDFIPVLDKNGVPCMYDKVERKYYYNAGTDQFIAGPVISE